jgi:hypothetical protein
MWECPRCRKPVDDDLAVCADCGASRTSTADPRGARGGSEPAHDADVVELCSAADAFEAHAIVNALASAGVAARVVGDVLQAAAGVPVGQAITPRVWVRSSDLAEARAIVAGLQAGLAGDTPADFDGEGPEEPEAAEEPEDQGDDRSNGYDVSFLSLLLILGGIACLAAGVYQGVASHQLLATYSETATAELVDFGLHPLVKTRRSPRESLGQSGAGVEFELDYGGTFTYQFSADGVSHHFVIERPTAGPQQLSIRYNPADPDDFRIDAIPSPILCVILGVVFGAFLLFFAYQFR